MLNGENMDNFIALYTSFLHFTFGTNSMHTSPLAYGIFVFFTAFFHKVYAVELQVKDCCGVSQSCTDGLGQSGSSWDEYMQE